MDRRKECLWDSETAVWTGEECLLAYAHWSSMRTCWEHTNHQGHQGPPHAQWIAEVSNLVPCVSLWRYTKGFTSCFVIALAKPTLPMISWTDGKLGHLLFWIEHQLGAGWATLCQGSRSLVKVLNAACCSTSNALYLDLSCVHGNGCGP